MPILDVPQNGLILINLTHNSVFTMVWFPLWHGGFHFVQSSGGIIMVQVAQVALSVATQRPKNSQSWSPVLTDNGLWRSSQHMTHFSYWIYWFNFKLLRRIGESSDALPMFCSRNVQFQTFWSFPALWAWTLYIVARLSPNRNFAYFQWELQSIVVNEIQLRFPLFPSFFIALFSKKEPVSSFIFSAYCLEGWNKTKRPGSSSTMVAFNKKNPWDVRNADFFVTRVNYHDVCISKIMMILILCKLVQSQKCGLQRQRKSEHMFAYFVCLFWILYIPRWWCWTKVVAQRKGRDWSAELQWKRETSPNKQDESHQSHRNIFNSSIWKHTAKTDIHPCFRILPLLSLAQFVVWIGHGRQVCLSRGAILLQTFSGLGSEAC